MPKSRPQIYVFLDNLTNALRHIGRDQLAHEIKKATERDNQSIAFIFLTHWLMRWTNLHVVYPPILMALSIFLQLNLPVQVL